MTLANMRQNGVRAVIASCANCGRSADVNVDALPETLAVPDAGKRLRCSQCGGKTISNPTGMAYREPTSRHAGLSTASDAALIKHDVASSGGARHVIHNTQSR